jgi:steroid delta-isomerase-like uncharacterized protein
MSNISLYTRQLLGPGMACMIALTGCATAGGSSSAADDPMMSAYRDYKAAWNRHDVDAIVGYYVEGGALNNPAAGGPVSGEALAGWLQATFTAIPDFKLNTVSAVRLDGDTVADQWVITGTWTRPFPGGPLAGAPPTGKSFSVPGAGFYEWQEGKMAAGTHYMDQMALLTQIGVIPPPGEGPQASEQ